MNRTPFALTYRYANGDANRVPLTVAGRRVTDRRVARKLCRLSTRIARELQVMQRAARPVVTVTFSRIRG